MLLKTSLVCVLSMFLICNQAPGQSLQEVQPLLEKGQYAAAQQQLEFLLKKEPENQQALLLLGQAHCQQTHFDQAIKVLKPLRKEMKERADLYYWLGESYKGKLLATENFLEKGVLSSKVKEYLEKAIDLDPKHTAARESVAYFYFSAPGIVGGSKKKAFQQAEIIQSIDKRRGLILAGNLYRQHKDYLKAIQVYQTLINLEPQEANWHLLLGSSFQLNENYEKAFQAFQQALVLDQSKAAAHYQFARTGVLSKQRTDESIAHMQNFLSLNATKSYPKSSAYWRLGMLYEIKGEKEKAMNAYEKGLSLSPTDKNLVKAIEALKE